MDNVDKSLNCVHVNWQRTKGEEGKQLSAKYYDLVPVDTLRGVVHLVPGDIEIPFASDHVRRKQKYDLMRNGENGWVSKIFYVNRFYRSKGELYNYEE